MLEAYWYFNRIQSVKQVVSFSIDGRLLLVG